MAKDRENTNGFNVLKEAIKNKNPGRLYFFYGEEDFLQNYYLERLKKILLDDLTESFNFHKLTNENFDIHAFADAVENLPMMAERTMVLVEDIDIFKLTEDDRTKISEIFSDIPDYCTIVFFYLTTDWKPDKRLKKLYESITENGLVVEFAKQDQRDLVSWITRHFAANKKTISQELCVYLIEITGGTMTALAGEISKICAYSGADHITKSDIDAVTEPVLDAVAFQLTDCFGQRNYAQALEKLRQLLKMQQEPLSVLGAIGSHFRRLGVAKTLADNGKNYQDFMRIYGAKDYYAKKSMTACRQFSAPFYAKANELIMETDRKIKTSVDEPERLLELLILQLAQEARNG